MRALLGLLALACWLVALPSCTGHTDQDGVEPERRVALAQSVFANSADDWGVVGEVVEKRVEHGTFQATDDGAGVWFFKAPPKFLGDQRLAYSGRLVYSFGHFHSDAAGRDPAMVEDLVLISELHNLTVMRAGLVQAWVYAQEIDVDLSPSPAWRLSSGAPASPDDLQRVLSSLSSLLIRGGFYHGRETAWIRDVHLYRRATPALPSEFPPPSPAADAATGSFLDAPVALPPRVRKRAVLERKAWEAEGGGEVQPYVAREAYDSLLELKVELEESEEALRSAAAELQGKQAALAEEARRLRTALAEAKDSQQRNADLADARGRNFKEAERGRVAAERKAADLAGRFEAADQLRIQKQVRIEELLARGNAGGGGGAGEGVCAGGQELADVRARLEAALGALAEAERAGKSAGEEAGVCKAGEAALAEKLTSCEERGGAARDATEEVRRLLAAPAAALAAKLAETQDGQRHATSRLAVACATRESEALRAVGCLLLLPFGLLLLGLPLLSARGGVRTPLASIAAVGDLGVLLTWLSSAAYLSFKTQVDEQVSRADAGSLLALLAPLRSPDMVVPLRLAGGVMYGTVLTLHLLSLFSSPHLLSAVQGLAFWAVGLHYYNSLFSLPPSSASPAPPSSPEDDSGVLALLVYATALGLIASLRGPTPPAARAGGGRRGGRGGAWRPAGAGMGRRRVGVDGEDEGELSLSDEPSDSEGEEEEGEEAARFPSDPAATTKRPLSDFFAEFEGKFKSDGGKAKAGGVQVPKQFARDVLRMIRIDGRRPDGTTDEERVASAHRAISEACGRLKGKEGARPRGRNLAQVLALATQNLGITLYEATLKRYQVADASVAVMQAGHHYIDIATAGGGLTITVVAYFKLHQAQDLSVAPFLIQASLSVDVAAGEVVTECSRPIKASAQSIEDLQGEAGEAGEGAEKANDDA